MREGSPGIEKAYGWGRSQSGRFLRGFVYEGFNVSDGGGRIFDGIFSHVAGGGRLRLNYRFAQPDRYPRQHEDHLYPSEEFPFAYGRTQDPFTGETGRRPETAGDGPPGHPHADRHRVLAAARLAGAHGPRRRRPPGARATPVSTCSRRLQHNDAAAALEGGVPRYPLNPLPANPVLRALLNDLDEWVTDGGGASRQPRAAAVRRRTHRAGRLSETASRRCRDAPVAEPHAMHPVDRGADFANGVIASEPPREDLTREYPVLVPAVDADGNETAGVRVPEVAAPLATYTGLEPPQGLGSDGGHRRQRPALRRDRAGARREERPAPFHRSALSLAGGLIWAEVRAAAEELREQRLLLAEDVERCVARAGKRWDARRGNGSGRRIA